MRPSHPLLAALLLPLGLSTVVFAGEQENRPIAERASAGYSRIVGTVRDQAGAAVAGVSVLAFGTTLAAAKSDITGFFAMQVPVGEYVLRAARDGYVSTYREAVRVQSDAPLRRIITLLKAGESTEAQPRSGTLGAGTALRAPPDVAVPSEVTWRLRHLPQSVLRERGTSWSLADEGSRDSASAARETFWTAMDLRGSLDLMTTSSLVMSQGEPVAGAFPSGVAYVVVGAPVGTRGDWTMRAALAADDASAWTLVGEYRARPEQAHRVRAGVTYSAQTLPTEHGDLRRLAMPDDVLRVGGLYGYDRWSVANGFELSYGGRFDRFDYLAQPNLAGGSVRATQQIAPRVFAFAGASRSMVAPGADQFQPPSVTGVWLPPDRTFAALDSMEPIGAAEVDRAEGGAMVSLIRRGRGDASVDEDLTFGVSGFYEQTERQIATIFGLDSQSPVGHYHVGTVGHPRVQGVVVELAGRLGANARGRVAYAATQTMWIPSDTVELIANTERLGVSRADRRGHDVTTTFEGLLPMTDTRVNMAARVNDWFSGSRDRGPGVAARFAIELQQPLPFHALGKDALMLVVGARTLLGDSLTGRSFYDDLVTIDPPLRVTCGIQMRF